MIQSRNDSLHNIFTISDVPPCFALPVLKGFGYPPAGLYFPLGPGLVEGVVAFTLCRTIIIPGVRVGVADHTVKV